MNLMDHVEREHMKKSLPDIRVGYTVKVHFRVIEGDKERTQVIQGLVIAKKHTGIRETITVRKTSFGIGVERIFPLHSPRVEKIEIVRAGKVRQAKLYYLRDLSGKAARLTEIITSDKGSEDSAASGAVSASASGTVSAAPKKKKEKGAKKDKPAAAKPKKK